MLLTVVITVNTNDYNNKPRRKRISPEQFCLLTELFQQTDTPSHELRERLAKKLNMTNREVQVYKSCCVGGLCEIKKFKAM